MRRRYVDTFENLALILPYFDNVDVFENSSKEFTRIYKKKSDKILLDLLDDYDYLKFIRQN